MPGQTARAQQPGFYMGGIGLRFASDFNRFFQAEENDLAPGRFSNIVIGPFYKQYVGTGIVEAGVNFCYKGLEGEGFSLPLVTQDFDDNYSTAMTSLELDFKVGPRIGWIYPKFGMIVGYFLNQEGFFLPGANTETELNRWYAAIPIGVSLELPTSFGTTGGGIFYDIGVSNMISGKSDEGGKIRAFNFEIHVALRTTRER